VLISWDPQAKRELGLSAKDVRDNQLKVILTVFFSMYYVCIPIMTYISKMQSEYQTCFPSELDELLDKRYLFLYKVSEHFNIKRGNRIYSLKRLTNDMDIIDKFVEKDEVLALLIKLNISE
jgi:hypothetical protein